MKINFDEIVSGANDYIQTEYGISNFKAEEHPTERKFSIWQKQFIITYEKLGEVKNVTVRVYEPLDKEIYRTMMFEFLRQQQIHFNVKILKGKYKDSIGLLRNKSIQLGNDVLGKPKRIPALSKKNIQLIPEDVSPTLEYTNVDKKVVDVFGKTININDYVAYINYSNITFGLYKGYDSIIKKLVIKLPDNNIRAITENPNRIISLTQIDKKELKSQFLTSMLSK